MQDWSSDAYKEKRKRKIDCSGKPVQEKPETPEPILVPEPVVEPVVIPGPVNTPVVGGPENPGTILPGIGTTTGLVSAEASAASRAKYIEGLDAFNQDDYERARSAWIVAKQLDPGNSDADLGLRKLEELMR